MTWILILAWIGSGHAAVTIPGYQDAAACIAAANKATGADQAFCIPAPSVGCSK